MTFNGHNDLEFDIYNDFEGYLKVKDIFKKIYPYFLWLKCLKMEFYVLVKIKVKVMVMVKDILNVKFSALFESVIKNRGFHFKKNEFDLI